MLFFKLFICSIFIKIDFYCFSEFVEGHSGINLIPVDPLHIPNIEIKQGAESPVNIELKFTDVDLVGLSNCRFTKIGFVCFLRMF